MTTLTASVHFILHQIKPFLVVLAMFGSNLATGSVRAGRSTAARPPRNRDFYFSSRALSSYNADPIFTPICTPVLCTDTQLQRRMHCAKLHKHAHLCAVLREQEHAGPPRVLR